MKENFTLPNIISAFRIVLIPVFAVLYFSNIEKNYIYAFAVLALSALSDVTDGFIARRFNMISELGKVLDPIADKLTQVALALCLCFKHRLLFPVLIVLVTKELLTAVAAALWFKNGMKAFSARWWGKVSTLVLYASFMYYVICDILNFMCVYVEITLTVAAIAFMMLSMCGYIKTYLCKQK